MNKRKNINKVPKTFTVALFFALFFWLLIKLSKEYKTIISLPVEYVQVPQDKIIQNTPLGQIEIQVRASGFRLVGLSIFSKKIQLDVRKAQRKSSSNYYFVSSNHLIEIQNQISNKYVLEQVVQDTIPLSLGQLTSRMIPVKGDFDITYKLGYHLTKPIILKPDSVLVSGPKEQIDTLQNLQLQPMVLNELSESINTIVSIKEVSSMIKFTQKEVKIIGEIDRFTEGNLSVPFSIINLPKDVNVNTFPTTLNIVFQVGLNNFNKVNTSSFQVVCDYQHSIDNGLNYLIPKVIAKPDFVTSVIVNPNKVEFLIQK